MFANRRALAMHMRENGIRHATVVINNRSCAGRYGCETLVGLILSKGSTLTVYGTNGYMKTILGGQRAPRQR
ncbi:DddA-like double-stranded DNA deaminase toxin [Saccharothrix deserti]|uniref:DddA-like double-stranded DNA deaminase toxin n=1 Tax=Saccharothrix deserti TaxID=2593674 RepID=UPI001EE41FBA|nr:DddA-like double-stranded DNA deaminase toxin [Saccharothrix deserti]